MTAKEYLTQLIEMDKEICRKQQRIENLRTVVMNITPKITDEVVQRTREKNPFEKIMVKIVDLERELDADADRLSDLKAEAWELLDRMPDERYKRILWLKYAERKTWKFIASEVDFTPRHTIRVHEKALDDFQKIFEKFENVIQCHLDVTP